MSATDVVATHLLPPILQRPRAQAPGIAVEVISSNALSDLQRREADIAIRHVQPEQPELIARLVREARACFYASESWVQTHGHPRSAEDAVNAEFVVQDRAGRYLAYLRHYGLNLSEDNFTCYADHIRDPLVAGAPGHGHRRYDGRDRPRNAGHRPRALDDGAGAFSVWLVSHRELRTSRRIRVVFEALAEGLAVDS